ncbi:MAG TPA: hypothetical protein VHS06_11450, partial [Chloroflexota bacterium]|nr:hypothetical protein [Chloroflexota bacterium]
RVMMLFAFSLSESVLAAGKKPFQLSDVMKESAILRKAGVNSFLYLTFGGYGETPATVEETISHIPYVAPSYTLMDHGFRIQSGTELRDLAVTQGIISPEDDCFKATFYHSPETPAEMLDARIKKYHRQHRLIGRSGISWATRFVWDKVRP